MQPWEVGKWPGQRLTFSNSTTDRKGPNVTLKRFLGQVCGTPFQLTPVPEQLTHRICPLDCYLGQVKRLSPKCSPRKLENDLAIAWSFSNSTTDSNGPNVTLKRFLVQACGTPFQLIPVPERSTRGIHRLDCLRGQAQRLSPECSSRKLANGLASAWSFS